MIDSKTRLNGIINSLSAQVSKVKFLQYYPGSQLQLPLKDTFIANVGIKSEEKTERKQKIIYRITLLAGIDTNGTAMLEKANQIISVLLKYNNSDITSYTNIQCNMGNIEYLPSDRCLRMYIDYTLQNDDGTVNMYAIVNGKQIAAALLSEKSSNSNIDVKVYGKSKPYDMLFGKTEYTVKLRLTEPITESIVNLKYTFGKATYIYNNCCIDSCNIYMVDGKRWYEYQVFTTERVIE